MKSSNHVARMIAAGVGVLALAGAGTVMATTEPPQDTMAGEDTSMSTGDTSMGSAAPNGGAGPSDCPAITGGAEGSAAEGSAAADATDMAAGTDAAASTEAADVSEAPAGTEMAEGTAAAATDMAEGTDAAAGTDMVDASAPPMDGPVLQIVETDAYGPILVDGACFTVYAFTNDVDGETTCVDDCAVNWPPLFVADEVPPLADELDPSLFSVVEHPDGPMLKVGDWPLYYFAGDMAPGDMNGQGVGDVWWVVAPDGTLIETVAGGEPDGTEAAGTEAAGTEADGTEADGTEADGTEADGTEAAGTEAPATTEG